MRIPTLGERHILKPFQYWSVEDFHQIRIHLRRLKVVIWLLEKSNEGSIEKELSGLKVEVDDLIKYCGNIRDLDIVLEFLTSKKEIAKSVQKGIIASRKKYLLGLQKKWPLNRRKKLLRQIKTTYSQPKQKVLLPLEYILKQRNKKKRKLFKEMPRTKSQWHKFRRTLRRITYLDELLGREHPKRILLQKRLGQIHDLEIIKSYLGTTSKLVLKEKRKIRKIKKIFSEMS